MSSLARGHDPYRRRREAGEASRAATRRSLLAAADELFRERGYAATTVTAIAEGAGVSLQTLYLVWGSKAALFSAAGSAVAEDSDLPLSPESWQQAITAALNEQINTSCDRDPTAQTYLAVAVGLFTRVVERAFPYWRMQREAAGLDPELAVLWAGVNAERRRTMRAVAAAIPRRGLRSDLTDDEIADSLWALASPDLYDVLHRQGGYNTEEFRHWLENLLIRHLCVPV